MRKRIRVLEVCRYYSPHVGGVERVVKDLAEGLDRSRYHVRVLACSERGVQHGVRSQNGVLVVRARSHGQFLSVPLSAHFFVLLRRMIRWCDIVHWHEPFPSACLALLVVGGNVPKVVTWHSDVIRQRLSGWLYKGLQHRVLRDVSAIVPTTARLGTLSPIISRHSNKQLPIHIGIDIRLYSTIEAPREANWLHHKRPRGRYALFVGRLCYYKGLRVLMEATALTEVTVVIVGDGVLREYLEAEIARCRLQDRAHLVGGQISDEELKLYYKHSDFLVLPSTHASEAFGIVQVEAMSFGKPVINTALRTGVPSVSIHNLTGLTVPPGDAVELARAMQLLWRDDGLRERLGKEGRKRAEKQFDSRTMLAEYGDLFYALVASRAVPSRMMSELPAARFPGA